MPVPPSAGPGGAGGRTNLTAVCPLAAIIALMPGCAWVPQNRVEDCRQRVQVLQAENQKLRDVVVQVRQENQDLAQRSLDDTRRLRAQDEAIRRYERSIADYQDEREQLQALLDQIRGEIRTAAVSPPTTAMTRRLEAFAQAHPDCRFDPSRSTLRLPASDLFSPDHRALTPGGGALLDALAEALSGPESAGLSLRVAASVDATAPTQAHGDVQLTSITSGPSPAAGVAPASEGLERARQIRDGLAERLGIDPSRVAVSAGGEPEPNGRAVTPGSGREGWVAIEVRRLADPRPGGPGP